MLPKWGGTNQTAPQSATWHHHNIADQICMKLTQICSRSFLNFFFIEVLNGSDVQPESSQSNLPSCFQLTCQLGFRNSRLGWNEAQTCHVLRPFSLFRSVSTWGFIICEGPIQSWSNVLVLLEKCNKKAMPTKRVLSRSCHCAQPTSPSQYCSGLVDLAQNSIGWLLQMDGGGVGEESTNLCFCLQSHDDCLPVK